MSNAQKDTVTIHGSDWKLSDIAESIADCNHSSWEQRTWFPRDALIHRNGGTASLYVGQKYDPANIDLVKGGWSHDHCQICWWDLYESEDPEHSIGYTDENNWVCSECYERFISSNDESANTGI